MNYSFALLNPRPTSSAEAANNSIFVRGPALGIEVTVPALAQRCSLGNIDPQHSGADSSRAAIQEALEFALPPSGSVLVTIRPDLDALGAMAILQLRATAVRLTAEAVTRIERIVAADRFAHGPWPGPRPILSCGIDRDCDGDLSAIASLVADHGRSMSDRVRDVCDWLTTGTMPTDYAMRAHEERQELTQLIASGKVQIESLCKGRIAVVQTTHRAAISLGYGYAPVVVAKNDAFRLQGSAPHLKYTVAQYALGHVNLVSACAALAIREPGWGGSPTIIGSPQGSSSVLSLDDVFHEVERALNP